MYQVRFWNTLEAHLEGLIKYQRLLLLSIQVDSILFVKLDSAEHTSTKSTLSACEGADECDQKLNDFIQQQ